MIADSKCINRDSLRSLLMLIVRRLGYRLAPGFSPQRGAGTRPGLGGMVPDERHFLHALGRHFFQSISIEKHQSPVALRRPFA